jgi:hypothetical protein
MASAKGAKHSSMMCEVLEHLVQEGLVDTRAVQAAVADEELHDVLRAENVVMLQQLNFLLSHLGLPLIPSSGGGADDDGPAGAENGADDDEMALLAELAALRGSDAGGGRRGGGEENVLAVEERGAGAAVEADEENEDELSSTVSDSSE